LRSGAILVTIVACPPKALGQHVLQHQPQKLHTAKYWTQRGSGGDWVVYAKTPLGGPAQVLEYLSRYTHRTAISHERIRAVTTKEVVFSVRAKTQGGKRLERLPGVEFVRRFLAHVLPTGVKRIRHYGVLASSCKRVKLNAARLALQMPLPNPQAVESAQGFMTRVARIDVSLCPCCKVGRLHVTAVLPGQARLPAPAPEVAQHSRGPP